MSGRQNKRFSVKTAVRILLCIIGGAAYGWGLVLYERMLMPLWLPVCAGIVIAGSTAPFFADHWKRVISAEYNLLNIVWHLAFVGAFGALTVLAGNYYGLSGAMSYERAVTVAEKWSEKHDTYRRVGRHARVRNGVRTDYKVKVVFPDSVTRKWPVSLDKYKRIRVGQTCPVEMRQGLFGYPVITKRPF